MSTFTIDVQDQEVRAELTALAARAANLQPVLQAIGEDIVERARKRFSTSTGPDGQRWKPNATATIAAYINRKGGSKRAQAAGAAKRPLIGESGDLRRQFHVNAVIDAVTISNSMAYAAIHQFGGQAGRGHKVTIPARPFLPVMENGTLYPDDRARIVATLRAYLAGK